MKLFNLRIISESEYKELRRSHNIQSTLVNVHRWFSGWKDLDIIWNYVFAETYFGDISMAREKYASARGTDVYGCAKQAQAEKLVKALETYLLSRKVVDKELDWDAYESLNAALADWRKETAGE